MTLDNRSVLTRLCYYNPQLLRHDWAIELVECQSGKSVTGGNNALILLFLGNTHKTDFNSTGFKMLWEREKNIKINELKYWMLMKPELMKRIILAVPEAE